MQATPKDFRANLLFGSCVKGDPTLVIISRLPAEDKAKTRGDWVFFCGMTITQTQRENPVGDD